MAYIPDRGDVVWISLDPQAGHEQSGHRPALVLSPASYNGKVGLMLCCPITGQAKGYPFEVVIEGNPKVSGVVLADQVKCLDWKARCAKKKGKVSTVEPAAGLRLFVDGGEVGLEGPLGNLEVGGRSHSLLK